MRLVVLDSGLASNLGHHANIFRNLSRAAAKRSLPIELFASVHVNQEIQRELGAVPLFRHFTYSLGDGDPVCGWMNVFLQGKEITRQDLARLQGLGPDDIIFFSTAHAAQLLAMIEWAAGLDPGQCPTIVVEVGIQIGADWTEAGNGERLLTVNNPMQHPGGVLYRFAAQRLVHLNGRAFHVGTVDRFTSDVMARLTGMPIETFPFPVAPVTSFRQRSAAGKITIASLGHQQVEKGYTLLPEIVRRTLSKWPNAEFLVHNSDPELKFVGKTPEFLAAHRDLHQMAAREPRLKLRNEAIDGENWLKLIDELDFIVCPYHVARYSILNSSVAGTAVSNGIPLVVPEGTAMAATLSEFGGGGATFEKFEPGSVADAIDRVMADYDAVAARAMAGARKWQQVQGADAFVANLVRLKGMPMNWPQAKPFGTLPSAING